MSREIVVTIGAGGIGLAIARRQGVGRTILLAERNEERLAASAADLESSGHAVVTHAVDISSRPATLAV